MTADVTKFVSIPMRAQDATLFLFNGLKYVAYGDKRAPALDLLMEALRHGTTPVVAMEEALLKLGARKL